MTINRLPCAAGASSLGTPRRGRRIATAAILGTALFSPPVGADVPAGTVLNEVEGSRGGAYDWYGYSVTGHPDFDGDGIPDMIAGTYLSDGLGANTGAVHVIKMLEDGRYQSSRRIANNSSGFPHVLAPGDWFGYSVTPVGDFDGNGVVDIAVGAPGDDGNGVDRGAVWIVHLTVQGQSGLAPKRIADGTGGFTGILGDYDLFGGAVAGLGDLDGDGVPDLAVGAVDDDDGGPDRGAVWILFLNADATVKGHRKISATSGGFTGVLDDGDLFGTAVTAVGDLDGNGTVDLAVGAREDDDGGPDRGAVWILFLASDGTVQSHQKISDTAGGFLGGLDNGDRFGSSLSLLGDLDYDQVPEFAVGARYDDDGGHDRGATWILSLHTDGTVGLSTKISDLAGGFDGALANDDSFGQAVARLGDLDGDGVAELAVSAPGDDGSAANAGSVWVLFLSDGYVLAEAKQRNDTFATNPTGYFALRPVMGRVWVASVDNGVQGNTMAGIVGYADAAEVYVPGLDDYLLVDPLSQGGELLFLGPKAGIGIVDFTLFIPNEVDLCGRSLCTQAFGIGGAPISLHNAYDLLVGTY